MSESKNYGLKRAPAISIELNTLTSSGMLPMLGCSPSDPESHFSCLYC